MDNFIFKNPTKIIFGKGSELEVGTEVSLYSKKILLHYGGNNIKNSGLYDTVIKSLKESNVEFIELAGVKPNPRLSLVHEGIKMCRENSINFILAVGGGSVIDSAKAISMGVQYDGDVWDFFTGKATLEKVIPVATIVTIPAAGSESSTSVVITNEDGWYKRGFGSPLIYPVFSILNPEFAFTLPKYQIACGVSDIIAHLMERYFTNSQSVELTDRLIEATMKTVLNNTHTVLNQPNHYDSWSQIMWSGTLAHNNLLNTGRLGDWASHAIEHELSGIYDIAHGAGLAIVFPAWMKYVYKHDISRFAQFASRVWNIEYNVWNPEKTALEGIAKLEDFYKSIGLKVRLKDVDISDDKLNEMADKCTHYNRPTIGQFVRLNAEDIRNILIIALK